MLEVSDLSVSYGRHRALEGVSVKVAKGEICVILGANGAGKSTLLKAIAGMVRTEAGSVSMNGKPIARLKAHRIVEEGIALVPEGRGIFGDLTVAENIALGAFAARARRDEQAAREAVYALFPRLAERKGQVARTMSGGEQQMVAIGRALMSRPEILMLDEPSLGLSPLLTQELFRALTQVAATGVGILLVEQNARQSLKIARRGYLIENGHVRGENTAQALMNDPAVVAAYLGGAGPGRAPRPSIALPPAFALPASLAGVGRAIGSLAGRAGAIQKAFVSAMRRDRPLPSAFVGRFDPKAGPDPWAAIAVSAEGAARNFAEAAPRAAAPAPDAQRLGGRAAAFAAGAAERLAAHVAIQRLNRPLPSAFQPRATPPAPDATRDAPPVSRLNGSHGLIGHNSAGLDLGIEGDIRAPAPPPDAPPPPGPPPGPQHAPTIADLAARAAAIQAAHVAERRRRLTSFVVPAAEAPPPVPSEQPATAPRPVPAAAAPSQRQERGADIAALAARAAAIQGAHVAGRRRQLAAFAVPPEEPAPRRPAAAAPPDYPPAHEAPPKKPKKSARDKRKKKHRKES